MRSGPAPDRGDLVWLDFDPHAGREQAGHRPALVLTDRDYNAKVGLAVFCPITSKSKGYPFEVQIPPGLKIQGVVLSDQLKSLDWRFRGIRRIDRAPVEVVDEVVARLSALLEAAS